MDNNLSMYDVIVVDEVHERHMMGRPLSIVRLMVDSLLDTNRGLLACFTKATPQSSYRLACGVDECHD